MSVPSSTRLREALLLGFSALLCAIVEQIDD